MLSSENTQNSAQIITQNDSQNHTRPRENRRNPLFNQPRTFFVSSATRLMRISGFGLVPAVYDPKTKLVTYAFTQKLVPKMYIVILTAKVNGKKVETRWDFTVDQAGPVATDQ